MDKKPDFIVDPSGHVKDVRGARFSNNSGSLPPGGAGPRIGNSAHPYQPASSKPGPAPQIILIPVGLIITLVIFILRQFSTPAEQDTYSDSAIQSYNSGIFDYIDGDYDMAVLNFNIAISSEPEFAEAYVGRGLVYDARGEYGLAIADFDRAIKFLPQSASAYNNRGTTFTNMGEYDKAVLDFDQAILLEANFAKAYYNRGLIKNIQGSYDAAVADFSRAIQYTSESSYLIGSGSAASQPTSSFTSSILGLRQLEQSGADLSLAYFNRALAYMSLGDIVNAQADMQKALELDPDLAGNEQLQWLLGSISPENKSQSLETTLPVEMPILQTGSFYALAVDPTTPSTVYAAKADELNGSLGSVFKSQDSGENWFAVNAGLTHTNITALVIDPLAPATLYAGTTEGLRDGPGGVFKSTDGGESWRSVNTGLTFLDVRCLAIDPLAPSTLYAGTYNGGIFKSTDGGENWITPTTSNPFTGVFALAIDPQAPSTIFAGTLNGLFKSTNGGAGWSPTSLADAFIQVIVVDPQIPGVIYVGATTGLFKSIDGGESWFSINTGLADTYIRALAIDPREPSTLYAGGFGVYKSTGGGETWSQAPNSLSTSIVLTLAIDPLEPSTLYVGLMEGGVVVVHNWSELTHPAIKSQP
jgi:tetratricopeptide (TPR) repeat protein